ncbi:MAG: hypothetical protein QM820_64660 [Minicystis sp.]
MAALLRRSRGLFSLGVAPSDNGARPLADVAIACGYASQAHFSTALESTAFEAATGLSPGRFRR